MSAMNDYVIGRAEAILTERGIEYTDAAWDAIVAELTTSPVAA